MHRSMPGYVSATALDLSSRFPARGEPYLILRHYESSNSVVHFTSPYQFQHMRCISGVSNLGMLMCGAEPGWLTCVADDACLCLYDMALYSVSSQIQQQVPFLTY
jgi:hypothetical protein